MWGPHRHAPAQPRPTWPRQPLAGVISALAPTALGRPNALGLPRPSSDWFAVAPPAIHWQPYTFALPQRLGRYCNIAHISLLISPIPVNLACEHLIVMSILQQKKKKTMARARAVTAEKTAGVVIIHISIGQIETIENYDSGELGNNWLKSQTSKKPGLTNRSNTRG